MSSVLERLPLGARVAVIRLRSLGDCVLTTPALTLLHEFRPDLAIHVVVEDRFAAIFKGHRSVAGVVSPRSLTVARSVSPHLCLNFHGGPRSLWMTLFSGAQIRAGFAHHPGSFTYHQPIPRAQQILGEERTVHTAEHLASAMFHLGVPRREVPRASLEAQPFSASRPYAVIHPFASAPEKAWPAEKFREAAAFVQSSLGLEARIIGAPSDDVTPFAEFTCHRGQSLDETKSLLAGASLFLGNDSGPAHMAAAFGLPVVVLFGSSDPVVWAPWRTRAEKFVSPAGIGLISVADVIAAAQRLWSRQEISA